jgi:hypothetical protein
MFNLLSHKRNANQKNIEIPSRRQTATKSVKVLVKKNLYALLISATTMEIIVKVSPKTESRTSI